jgi:hypothetical protein
MNAGVYEVARRKLVVLLHLACVRMSSSRYGAEQPGEGYAAAAASVPQVMADLERCKPGTRLPERPGPDQDLVAARDARAALRPEGRPRTLRGAPSGK